MTLSAEQVRNWKRYADTSPLYQRLTDVIADDDRLRAILNQIKNLPPHNLLFAGVQYLMLRDGPGDLGAFYPNFTDEPIDPAGVADPFTDFVLAHASELVVIGNTRLTQTNECRRCVAILPAIWSTPATRFHLVDFGTSAGLNLNLDRYRYDWGDSTWGPDSPVALRTENRGEPVVPRPIEVLTRTGLDLDPIDPADADSRMWLEALVWPEHHDRRGRLLAALEIALLHPPRFVSGDALATLGPTLDALPGEEPAVVINSFILNQFPQETRGQVGETVREARNRRPVYRVSVEWLSKADDAATIAIDDGTRLRIVGMAQPHGEWIEFYARP